MRTEDLRIDRTALLRLLGEEYLLPAASLTFHPVGEDSFGYITNEISGRRYFVKVHDEFRRPGLEDQLAAAYALHHACGLEFVVPPQLTRGGAVQAAFDPFIVDVYPYLPGGHFFMDDEPVRAPARLGAMLGRLHRSFDCPALHLERDPYDAPFESWLFEVLDAARRTWPAGIRREAAALLEGNRGPILHALESHKREGLLLLSSGPPWLATHGDINWANLLQDASGEPRVIDWDGVRLGPSERDLIAFTGPELSEVLVAYLGGFIEPPSLDLERFRFFRYRWVLGEIADFGARLLLEDIPELECGPAWSELRRYVPIPESQIEEEMRRIEAALAPHVGT